MAGVSLPGIGPIESRDSLTVNSRTRAIGGLVFFSVSLWICACVSESSLFGVYVAYPAPNELVLNADSSFEYEVRVAATLEYATGTFRNMAPGQFLLNSSFPSLDLLPAEAFLSRRSSPDLASDSVYIVVGSRDRGRNEYIEEMLFELCPLTESLCRRPVPFGQVLAFPRTDSLLIESINVTWVPGIIAPFPKRQTISTVPISIWWRGSNVAEITFDFPLPTIFYYEPVVAETLAVDGNLLRWRGGTFRRSNDKTGI